MKKYNRTLLVALLIVAVFATAIGGTFAWFTDSEESTGNIIKSGTLDLGFTWAEYDSDEYKDASTGAIFDYKYWEPGYVQVRKVKIANLGDLAFKYQLNVKEDVASTGEYKLAQKIDVYTFPAGTTVDRATIAAATPVGTIADLMVDNDGAAHGVLLPAEGVGSTDVHEDDAPRGEVGMTIALKMQESAGNEYQNLSVGGNGFALELLATQYTWENDDFDHTYDGEADYVDPNLPSADVTLIDKETLANTLVSIYGIPGFAATGERAALDVGFTFTAKDTAEEAAESPYADWHADYVVSLDRDTKANTCGLAGQYDSWSEEWLGFKLPVDATAGQEFRLLRDAAGINFTYEMLCDLVKVFDCGVFNLSEENIGTKMTVKLCLFEPADPEVTNPNDEEETGKVIVVSTHVYELEAVQETNKDITDDQ